MESRSPSDFRSSFLGTHVDEGHSLGKQNLAWGCSVPYVTRVLFLDGCRTLASKHVMTYIHNLVVPTILCSSQQYRTGKEDAVLVSRFDLSFGRAPYLVDRHIGVSGLGSQRSVYFHVNGHVLC